MFAPCLPLRLGPGADLREALQQALQANGARAGFVVAGIGSLHGAAIRWAGAAGAERLSGDFEILTLAGSLSTTGSHLHISIADAAGQVRGGHVAPGCIVRTTAEVLIAWLAEWHFSREHDPATGYAELTIRRAADPTPRNGSSSAS